MTVNCYHVRNHGEKTESLWNSCSDKFPLQTYRGSAEQVLDCLRKLFNNSLSGINKVEILTDDELPEANVGQAPIQLGV